MPQTLKDGILKFKKGRFMKHGRLVDTTAEQVAVRYRRLPHWTAEAAIYFVTFRFADSLPASFLKEQRLILANLDLETDGEVLSARKREFMRETERWLDRGLGSCVLRNPECAQIVADAIRHFDGVRCDIYGWCVMPNHVHVVVSPYTEWSLSALTKSWKGFASRRINLMTGRTGRLFQPESFDHLIRSNKSLAGTLEYVRQNPLRVGLDNWPWVSVADVMEW